ncbi:methyltransferase domain-containing protein [Burkholderia sp. SCN-KJ]|uniref:methyltransferase domain-containing protein n=1 Tax=Burkholderia sp. SCN-KJ TaxID=2969248 RepID=UPI00214F68F2|nr:methyltransferase domain-containing protein [Burkholderia sp. SCN-KJ]MCR4468307.1 methyltransferase domain-containing protein [Burkholderia sp. SCN-KJ]
MSTLRFDTVDTVDSRACVAYLDVATQVGMQLGIKQRNIDLLELRDGETALDVGCGTGQDVCTMAQLVGFGGRVIGIDSSLTMVTEARQRTVGLGLPVEFHQADVYELPFDDGVFDACRADRIFHFLNRPAAALREMIRVTRVGGRIAVTEPDWSSLSIEGGDDALTHTVVRATISDGIGPSSIGARLPRLFAHCGLAVEKVVDSSLNLDDLATCRYLLQLDTLAGRAVAQGRLSADDARAWIASLEHAFAGGRLHCRLEGLTVVGTKLAIE